MLVRRAFGVFLSDLRVGRLDQIGDYTSFYFEESYLDSSSRPILGLAFEDSLRNRFNSALRLTPWFSNLLPEGELRRWVAESGTVSPDREMELLNIVGHDLPGAVRVIEVDEATGNVIGADVMTATATSRERADVGWKFSLAGVALKFSMLSDGTRLTLPASGEGGDWIVKLPDRYYRNVPVNEFETMKLAKRCGINVPSVRLVSRDLLGGLPEVIWPDGEDFAYAVERFDRGPNGELVHIEDFAQIRQLYPDDKYLGNYETVASLCYRNVDEPSLLEFVRRLAFIICLRSGDAHLKNWSLRYRDPGRPELSPAYDLVRTSVYRGAIEGEETLALKFCGSRRFERTSLRSFDRLALRLGVDAELLTHTARSVAELVKEAWPEYVEELGLSGLGTQGDECFADVFLRA